MIIENPDTSELTINTYIKYSIDDDIFIGKICIECECEFHVDDIVSFNQNDDDVYEDWVMRKCEIDRVYTIYELTNDLSDFHHKYVEYFI